MAVGTGAHNLQGAAGEWKYVASANRLSKLPQIVSQSQDRFSVYAQWVSRGTARDILWGWGRKVTKHVPDLRYPFPFHYHVELRCYI